MRMQCMWLWNGEATRDRKSLHMQKACVKYEFLLELNRTTRCLGGGREKQELLFVGRVIVWREW